MGILGAALATFLNYIFIFTVYMTVSQRLYYVPHRWKAILPAILITGIMSLLVPQWMLPEAGRWAINLLAIASFPALALGLGLIQREEMTLGWRLITKRLIN
jgi:hypothetical protein